MEKTEIEIVVKKNSITILTKENQITFSSSEEEIQVFSTAELSTSMLDDLERTKIVKVKRYSFSGNSNLILEKMFGYSNEAFTDCLVDLILKNNL